MNARDVADATAVAVTFGAVVEWIPAIAGILAIVWTGIRIYEWARQRVFGKPKDIDL